MNKQRWIMGLAVMLMGSTLYGLTNTRGVTGLIEMPTAEALKMKEYSVGMDVQVDSDRSQYLYHVSLGGFVGNENMEVGVIGGSHEQYPTEGVLINLKYHLTDERSQRYPFSVAVGAERLFSKHSTDVYMVASKIFRGGWRGHGGFNAAFSDKLYLSGMVGVQYYASDNISFLGEVIGSESQYKGNAGIQLALFDRMPELFLRAQILDLFGSAIDDGTAKPHGSVGVVYQQFL